MGTSYRPDNPFAKTGGRKPYRPDNPFAEPPAEDPSLLERVGGFAKRLVTDTRGLKDAGRGLVNTAAGLLTAPGEGFARVTGATQAADALKGQREAAAKAVGPYETAIGPAAQIAGNLATAVVGGDPLQTATAASSKDASTLALIGDLVKKASSGKGDAADWAAERISQLADNPATRGIFEYAVGRLSAGAAGLVMRKIKARQGLPSNGTMRAPTTYDPGPPGDVQGPAIPMPGDKPADLLPTAGQAAARRQAQKEAADVAARVKALENARPAAPAGVPSIVTADVDPRLVGQGVPRRPNATKTPGGTLVESPIQGPSSMENARLVDRAPAGRVPESTPAEDRQALAAILRGENLDASRALRNARGGLTDPGRANFFPGPEALAAVAAKPAITTGIGATIGAANNDEDRWEGAILGGSAGYLFGVGVRGVKAAVAARRMAAVPSIANAPAPVKAMYGVVSASIDRSGDLERMALARSKGDFMTRFRRVADAVADAERPIDRFSDQAVAAGLAPLDAPSTALNRALDVDATLHRFYYSKPIDPMTGQDIGLSMRDVMEPLAGKIGGIREAWDYVVSQRIANRGIDAFTGDAQRFAAFEGVAQHLAKNPDNIAFADRLTQYTDAVGRYAVASGLWTAEQWQKMKDADALFVPFRDLEAYVQRGQTLKPGAPTGLNISKAVPRYGSVEPEFILRDPAKSLLEYTSRVIRRADQARLNRTLFDAAEALGLEGEAILTRLPNTDPRILQAKNAEMALAAAGMDATQAAAAGALFVDKISGANQVIQSIDATGQTQYALLNAPELASALSALRSTPGTRGSAAVMKVLAFPRRIATLAATGWNPRFFLMKNPMMDVPDAIFKNKGVRPKDIASGFGASMRQAMYTHLQESMPQLAQWVGPSAMADEASRFGLSNTSLFSAPLDPESVARQLSPGSATDVLTSSIGRAAGEPIRFGESVAAAMDMGPKLAVYSAMKREMRKQGIGVIDAAAGAATRAARATVDYRRSSSIQALQFLYAVIPFARASMLATKRYASFAKASPARAATAASAAAMLGMVEWALNHDDPNMTDRASTERMQGPEYTLPDGTVVQVPMSPEMNAFRSGMYWAANKVAGEDPQAGKLLRESILRALPPGIADYASSRDPLAAIPIPGLQGMLEADRNKTVFGKRTITPKRMEGLVPEMQRFPSTAPTFDALAQGLRASGLGPKVNALQVENVVRDVTGGFTPGVLALTDPIARAVTGRSARERVPDPASASTLNPLSALVKQKVPNRTESETDFYAFRDRVSEAQKSKDAMLKAARQTEPESVARQSAIRDLERFAENYATALTPEAETVIETTGDILKQMAAEEQAIQQAYQNKDIDTAKARQRLDEIKALRQELYRTANARLRKILPSP